MRDILGGQIRRWPAAAYGAVFALFGLPFATFYSACAHDRIDTVNGYQTLAQHDYSYQAANGSTKVTSVLALFFAAGGPKASSEAEIGRPASRSRGAQDAGHARASARDVQARLVRAAER